MPTPHNRLPAWLLPLTRAECLGRIARSSPAFIAKCNPAASRLSAGEFRLHNPADRGINRMAICPAIGISLIATSVCVLAHYSAPIRQLNGLAQTVDGASHLAAALQRGGQFQCECGYSNPLANSGIPTGAAEWPTRRPPPKLVTQTSFASKGLKNTRTGCRNG